MNSNRAVLRGLLFLFLTMSISYQASAADDNPGVTIVGVTDQTIPVYSKNGLKKSGDRTIELLKVSLSDDEKERLQQQAKDEREHKGQFVQSTLLTNDANAVYLSMNNVPVLDQGRHGTCITFALTAALDAIIGNGDYISQLCNLQLGSYLALHGYSDSGWDGAYPIDIINQITQYGIVNKKNQREKGCGGLYEYPVNSKYSQLQFISPEEYQPMSELMFGKIANWYNIYWRFISSWTLSNVKRALDAGDRTFFGVLLPRTDLGVVGAVGQHQVRNDTWVLSREISDSASNAEAGHAMIIIGYDDNAVAYDNNGVQHKGLLILRNSWGASIGDKGNFYMSYDYFKLLAVDVRQITRY